MQVSAKSIELGMIFLNSQNLLSFHMGSSDTLSKLALYGAEQFLKAQTNLGLLVDVGYLLKTNL